MKIIKVSRMNEDCSSYLKSDASVFKQLSSIEAYKHIKAVLHDTMGEH